VVDLLACIHADALFAQCCICCIGSDCAALQRWGALHQATRAALLLAEPELTLLLGVCQKLKELLWLLLLLLSNAASWQPEDLGLGRCPMTHKP